MKKITILIFMIMILIAMTLGLVYAGTGITQTDIDEGLSFCKEYPVGLALDGTEINFEEKDVPPVIIKERTLIPARALFEAMGGTVAWDNITQSVEIKFDDTTVKLVIGSETAIVNGEEKSLEVPAMIIDPDGDYYGSTMIPVRFTAEQLGYGVAWEDSTRSVLITASNKDIPIVDSVTEEPIDDLSDEEDTANSDLDSDSDIDSDSDLDSNSNSNIDLDMIIDAAKNKIVAIDIGHGGKDCGTIGHENQPDQIYEKDLNLPIGVMVNEYLKSAGVRTYMIRESDVYYTLLERANQANDNGATIFVSIHNNSNESSTPHGTEVLYYNKANTNGQSEAELYGIDSKTIAKNVQDEMVNILGTYDRGIKSSPGMAVLNKTSMPAIIIEGAFLSNESDFQMMKQADYINNYAKAVAKAIIKSLNDAYK